MAIEVHMGDLPNGLDLGASVAVDSETMGLLPHRDRLCVVQLSAGDGNAHLVHFNKPIYDCPNLKKLLADPGVEKLFHFARFDIAALKKYLGVECTPVYCTKIASKLVRTYSSSHGLKSLCQELLGIDLSKAQQSSDWGAEVLSPEQVNYAALDVLHLHEIREILDARLVRENRRELAQACFDFLPHRAALDLAGWPDDDIFAH